MTRKQMEQLLQSRMVQGRMVNLMPSFMTSKRVLVLSPHPDDELIGCGGSMLHLDPHLQEMVVCYLTDGGKGTNLPEQSAEEIARLREAEMRLVARSYAHVRSVQWHIPDAELQATPERSSQLAQLLCEFKPNIIFAPSPWELHPDHRGAFLLLAQALRQQVLEPDPTVLLYAVWNDGLSNSYVNITDVWERKRELIQLYQSQAFYRIAELSELMNQLAAIRLQRKGISYAEAFYRIAASKLDRLMQMAGVE